LNCYIVYAIEPEFDSILGAQALETLATADFVVAISAYQSDSLLEIADVILPLAHFSEHAGSVININGTIQDYTATVEPFGESRPGWKILRVLGNLAEINGFEYNTLEEVTHELQKHISIDNILPKWQAQAITPINVTSSTELVRIAPIALYAIDGIARRAKSLQATQDAHTAAKIEINAKTAQQLNVVAEEIVNVTAADATVQLRVVIDDAIADLTAVVYQANNHTLHLGTPYTKLEVRKC